MKISKAYGPQFDRTDGTIGDLQLVKRWMIVNEVTGNTFTSRQGRYTRQTKREVDEWITELEASNSPDRLQQIEGSPVKLVAVEFWCYPEHFDPVGLVTLPDLQG